MGAPLKMTPRDVRRLATFMEALSQATRDTDVRVGPHAPVDIEVADDATLRIWWNTEQRHYEVDDQNGW